jgi:hypothetical protein
MTTLTTCPGLERRVLELRDRVELAELFQLRLALVLALRQQRRTGGLAEARGAPVEDEVLEARHSLVDADLGVLVEAVHDRAVGGVVLRVLGDDDQLLDRHVLGYA